MREALETIAFEAGMELDPDSNGRFDRARLIWLEAVARNALPPESWLSTAKKPLDPWRGYPKEMRSKLTSIVDERRNGVKDIVSK
jgi:hypothetical protein